MGFSASIQQWVLALTPYFETVEPFGPSWPEVRELALELSKEKGGRPAPLMSTEEWLDSVIERTTSNLVLEQERKAGIIPGPPVIVDETVVRTP